MNFNISLIERIERSNELIFLDNMMYTLHAPVKAHPENFLYFLGVRYPIESGGRISILEEEVYKTNKEYLEKEMRSKVTKKFTDKIGEEQKAVSYTHLTLPTN